MKLVWRLKIVLRRCLLVVLAGLLFAGGVVYSAPNQEERLKALHRQSVLQEQDKELVEELLTLHVKTAAAQKQQKQLQEELPAVRRSLAESQVDLAAARARYGEKIERLGRWLNLLYRYGPVTYLEVLLEAADFSDFIVRAEMLSVVISSEINLLEEIMSLAGQIRGLVDFLAEKEGDLVFKEKEMAATVRNLAVYRADREGLIKRLRLESATLAEKITVMEEQLYRSLTPLHYFLNHFSEMPWDNLAPDRISRKGNKLRMEITEEQINRVVFKDGGAPLKNLEAHFGPDGLTLNGSVLPDGTGFSLSGRLVPAGEDRAKLEIRELRLSGIPVGKEVIDFIAADRQLELKWGDAAFSYRLSDIQTEEGRLVVVLEMIL